MDVTSIREAKEWFEVLQTTKRAQTAMMTLPPGESSGDEAEAHEKSDQVLLVLEGELFGEIGQEAVTLKADDVLVIPEGVKHRFTNRSKTPAVTFNVYAPPEYPAKAKG